MLTNLGIECSLSRRGDCHDNAVMERFYEAMKTERLNGKRSKHAINKERQCSNISKGFTIPIDGIRPWATLA